MMKKSDPNIKIASYVVSPIQMRQTPEKNESFKGKIKTEPNSEKNKQKKKNGL